MATQPLTVVDSQPLSSAPLSVVKSEPYQPPARDDIGAHLSALYEGLKTAPLAHPIDLIKSTLGMVAHPVDTLKGDADTRKQLYADSAKAFKNGDYGPGFVKGLLSFLPLVGPQLGAPYQEMKDAQAKGDTIGEARAAGKLLGIAGSAEIARNAPGIAAAAPEAAETVTAAVKGGAEAAKNAATEMIPLRKLGVSVNVPAVAVKSAVGSALGSAIGHPFGLSAEGGGAGAILGGAGPIAVETLRGIRDSIADLRAKRAAASQAAQAVADKIKSNVPAAVIPPERQLAPASSTQVGPITPSETVGSAQEPITYTPPTVPDTSGPIPTDQASGRPVSAVPPQPTPTNELITKDEIAKGMEGKADQGFIDAIYNQIHGIETPAPANALPADAASPLLTGELEYHAPDQPAQPNAPVESPVSATPSGPAPVAAVQPPAPIEATPAEEPPAPIKPPTSRVVDYPGDPAKEFAPSTLITEEGLAKYAKDNGITEEDAAGLLHGGGYQVIGRAQLNRALHAVGSELGMDHDKLSDVAKIKHRVKSMTQLSQEDMLGLYEDLLGKQSASEPIINKSDQMAAREAASKESIPTAPTSDTPTALQNNPKALAAAQALADALKEKP